MSKLELVKRVREILDNCCDEPAEQMIKEGEELVAIGKALKGMPVAEARAVLGSVVALEGFCAMKSGVLTNLDRKKQ